MTVLNLPPHLPRLRHARAVQQQFATTEAVETTFTYNAPIYEQHPPSGAVLRWLLAADPVVQLIVETLADLGGGPITLPKLAQRALQRERVRALTAFFKPEALAEITDAQNNIVWSRVLPQHFRSTTFFQYKSVLKHAGRIVAHALGGATTVDYQPENDLWELR